MKIEYIREFVDLAQTRSYSRTAERLFIAQPTLSKHIKAIESELKIPLIDRSVQGVGLTEAGKFAVGEFQRLLEVYKGIESRLDDMRSGFQGTLKLGLLYYATDSQYVPILRRFRKAYPNVSVKTIAGQPDQIFDAIVDGSVDAGFLVGVSGAMVSRWSDIKSVTVTSEPCVALCRVGDALAKNDHPTVQDLAGRKIVRYSNGEYLEHFADDLEAWLKAHGAAPSERVPLDNIDLLTAVVEETASVSLMPKHLAPFHRKLCAIEAEGLPTIEGCLLFREDNDNPSLGHLISTLSNG